VTVSRLRALSTIAMPQRSARSRAPQSGDSELADPYTLISIEPAAAPSGAGGAWHRYEIMQGQNVIVGYRAGSIKSVTLALESIIERLNDRRAYRRPRTDIVLDSEDKRKAASS
jgi:hypothetical protein